MLHPVPFVPGVGYFQHVDESGATQQFLSRVQGHEDIVARGGHHVFVGAPALRFNHFPDGEYRAEVLAIEYLQAVPVFRIYLLRQFLVDEYLTRGKVAGSNRAPHPVRSSIHRMQFAETRALVVVECDYGGFALGEFRFPVEHRHPVVYFRGDLLHHTGEAVVAGDECVQIIVATVIEECQTTGLVERVYYLVGLVILVVDRLGIHVLQGVPDDKRTGDYGGANHQAQDHDEGVHLAPGDVPESHPEEYPHTVAAVGDYAE